MWILLMLGLAFAEDGTTDGLDSVHRFQRKGQYVEAEAELARLLMEHSTPQLQFEWARNLELQGEYQSALVVYDELYPLRLIGDLGLNIAYRRGLVLSNLGKHREALQTLRRLRWRKLSAKDRRGLQLALGAAELMAGKTDKGMRRIERTLGELEQPNEWSWLQARARMAMCTLLLERANESALMAEGDLQAQMNMRADWILAAEKQIQVIIQLQEPEYVLLSIEAFADSLLLFFDELRMLPPPDTFTSTQVQLYESQLQEQAEMLADKALGYYRLAVRFGDGLFWKGPSYVRMQRKIEVLEQELSGF